ncbi:hypothetical protein BU23DRAFT_634678 [Bimuria novae-zelandiae CBS 107.79]|uniref:Saponin hydrolase n=1 Tax=Bimuria novae-zelandiae CBS 107.79 TaxID=1447943 RepID=A0A6A5UJ71_9PLEO|nr:hypothetical protein BU23DRAFT_634678 [Bimuria novae-zelandiae CBS 107.79]
MARLVSLGALLVAIALASASPRVPPPPEPEPIEIVELPLPPVSANNATGSCNLSINPRGTGCIAQKGGGSDTKTIGIIASGDFLPDGKHVITMATFVGAPEHPDPASIYDGEQILLIKTNNSTFPNGDPWKCLTCGMPADNAPHRTALLDYPQAFADGKRILAGDNIIDCGEYDLTSVECTPTVTYMYPIHWETSLDGEGKGGALRELRLHPDDIHLGFSSFNFINGQLGQSAYFARLQFNPSPEKGLPLGPRYDLLSVTRMVEPNAIPPISVKDGQVIINRDYISVGELRGFSGSGKEVIYVGFGWESSNTDAFAVHLQTGKIRRLTSHPEYVDPIDVSPDDNWSVIEDTRGTDRQMFLAGMRGIPPVTDLVSTRITTATRNNGPRRFFQPFLVDRYGDRGDYAGQKINGGPGVPGSGDIDDPEWNAMADPRWSPHGNEIVYWQAQTIFPECGGPNPLPCYPSKAPGGRTYRLMLAKLVSRAPKPYPPVEEASDEIPWGEPYIRGSVPNARGEPPQGVYTLKGKAAGYAKVSFAGAGNSASAPIANVAVTYHNFSDGKLTYTNGYEKGLAFINGYENVTLEFLSATNNLIHWYSDLVQTGQDGFIATKKTSPDGFHLNIDVTTNFFNASGTLTTTVNDKVYKQPLNAT